MNQDRPPPEPWSRRKFVGQIAQGAVIAGAALSRSPVHAADKNPFAYDVSRFKKTDPNLIRWEQVNRWVCPTKEARRLAFGPGDVLHVAAGQNVIRRSDAGSQAPLEVGVPVEAVAVAGDGTIYVAARDHVEVFDARGNRRAKWDSPAKRTWFSSLALAESDLFAADSGNRVVLRYDRSGKMVGRIGVKDPARNVPGFIVPSPYLDVKLHRDGLLRVNNPGRHRYEAYTIDGDFEGAWGKASAAIAGFCGCCNPIGLAVLPDGRVVTSEKGLPRVKVFNAEGELDAVVAGTESFADQLKACADPSDCTRGGLDVAADGKGRIHILDRITSEIRVFQPKANA